MTDTPPEMRLRQLMKEASLSSSGVKKIAQSDTNLTNIHELWLDYAEDISVNLTMMQSTSSFVKQKIPFTVDADDFQNYFSKPIPIHSTTTETTSNNNNNSGTNVTPNGQLEKQTQQPIQHKSPTKLHQQFKSQIRPETVVEEYFDTPDLQLLSHDPNLFLKKSSTKGWSLKENVEITSSVNKKLLRFRNYDGREVVVAHLRGINFPGVYDLSIEYSNCFAKFNISRYYVNKQQWCWIDEVNLEGEFFLFGSCYCHKCKETFVSFKVSETKLIKYLSMIQSPILSKIKHVLSVDEEMDTINANIKNNTPLNQMVANDEKCLTELFLETMDRELEQYTCFKKSLKIQFDEYQVTTYLHNEKSFIIDVVGDECCLTTKSENIIYVFYDDDYKEIIEEVLGKIEQFLE